MHLIPAARPETRRTARGGGGSKASIVEEKERSVQRHPTNTGRNIPAGSRDRTTHHKQQRASLGEPTARPQWQPTKHRRKEGRTQIHAQAIPSSLCLLFPHLGEPSLMASGVRIHVVLEERPPDLVHLKTPHQEGVPAQQTATTGYSNGGEAWHQPLPHHRLFHRSGLLTRHLVTTTGIHPVHLL